MSDTNIDNIYDDIRSLIGDTPVSEQLNIALNKMADKLHAHDEYITRDEYNELKVHVEMLMDLVGDVAVSEQISNAINKREVL